MGDGKSGGASGASGASAASCVPSWLHEAWIRRLRWHYDGYNADFAGRALRPPVILIVSAPERLGEWNGAVRTLSISERHILEHPWESVLETLRHEMAHQYVQEVLRAQGPPHGDAWASACRILRAEPSAKASREKLGRIDESSAERDKMLTRVKELLALAGSPNEHEAANAMRMAQKYLLKYNLDIRELGPSRCYATRSLGKCQAKFQEYEYALANILQDHFFVLVIYTWSYDPFSDKRGRILQISGTPENLDIAEYVYHYVMNLAEPLWKAHRKANRDHAGTRLQYFAGLLRGFQAKLDDQTKEISREQGLVWLGDPQLKDYYRYHYPRVRGGSMVGVSRGEGYAAGLRDGREITIRRGVGEGAGNRGRLIEG